MLSRTELVVGLATALPLMIAVAGTMAGGQLCAPRDPGGCGSVPPESERYDSDWHGWPIMWRTDMPSDWQDENDWDKTLVLTGGTSVSFPLLIISLGTWFTMATAAEAIAAGSWWLLIRRRKPDRLPAT